MPDLKELDKILTLSSAAMVFCACIVIGYVLRVISAFPNKYIPAMVIATGAVAMLLMADQMPEDAVRRVWVTRHLMAGLVLGFASWLAHNLVLSRLEDYLAKRFSVVGRVLGIETEPPKPPAP